MTAAVAPSAGDADAVHDIDDGIEAAGFSPVGGFCEHQSSVFDWGILGREGLLGWLVGDLPPAAGAFGGVDDFVEGRESADTGDHAVLEFDTDEGSEEWNAVYEGFCAVDGIDDPAEATCSGEAGKFFAEDRIVGEVGLDVLSDEEFSVAIGDGDRGFVGFGFDEESIGAEVLEDGGGGGVGDLECGLEANMEGIQGD
jgi:hypothetical protein